MKTKLLKLALCAMATLPMGAWAAQKVVLSYNYAKLATNDGNLGYGNSQTITSGTSEKILGTNVYPFSVVYNEKTIIEEGNIYVNRNTLMLRYPNVTNIGLHIPAETFFAFKGLKAGDRVEVAYRGGGDLTFDTSKLKNLTYVSTSHTYTLSFYYGSERTNDYINVHVMTVTADGDAGFSVPAANGKESQIARILITRDDGEGEYKVSTPTTWIFNDVSERYTELASPTADYYLRTAGSSLGGRYFIPKSSTEGQLVFADGSQTESITKVLSVNGKFLHDNLAATTAGADITAQTQGVGCFAFNAAVPGTVYAKLRHTGSGTGYHRIYFYNGSTLANLTSVAATKDEIQEVSATINVAGSFFIGTVAGGSYDIIAVRFVPSEIKTTIGSHGKSSFSCAQGLDFSSATPAGLKAYKAKEVNGDGLVVLSSVDEAPAGTGLILSGEPDTEYTIPVKDNAAGVGTNLMVGTITATAVAASTDDVHNYIWAYTASGLGFYNVAAATTSAAGKAYLSTGTTELSTTSSSRGFIFEDEDVTGIDAVKGSELKVNDEYFNLNGQRVAQPKKGLYIVNGKKVVIR